ERQGEKESAAHTDLALRPDPTALAFDKALGDRQPEACAAPARLACAPKPVENMDEAGFRNSGAGIGYRKANLTGAWRNAHNDCSSGRRKFDRIVNQVSEDLMNSIWITLRLELVLSGKLAFQP